MMTSFRLQRVNQFLIAFHREAPVLFWVFALGIGIALGFSVVVTIGHLGIRP